jgi:hypothetical protein
VRKWYWESFGILNDSYNKGIIGYWNDEADTYGGNNMFLQMQRANYEGQRSFNNERVWSINRNFFLGAQRYAYGHWSGDIGSGFYEMARQRLFMLSSVVLGSAWWGMDIGGFSQSPTPENYYRWIQFGAFVPIFRVHGSLNAEREPWRYGAEAESIATRYIRLRYRLMPYIYSAAWKNHVSGTPIVRPLVMDYPRDHSVSDQYDEWMFGDDILVAPVVYQGATSQQIYLPEGDWIDFHTGMKYDGPTYFQHAVTKQDIPIFVKAGAVIPMAPVGNFVDDSIARSALIFSCYPGGNSSTVVYEDDGMTYDYEKGTYRLITATHSSAAGKRMLSMERRTGALLVPPRSFVVEFNGIGATPDSVLIDSTLMVKQVLDSIRNGNSSGWAYDAIAKQCLVRFQEDGLPHAVTAFYNPGIEGALDHDVNHPAESLRLFDNYPNPFNASTTISYTILTVSNISMVALNVLGQVVEQIESGEREAGHHAFKWNTELPSGVYFIRIESFPVGAPGVCSRELKRMMILR